MSTRRLEKDEWQSYFDAVSRHIEGRRVDVIVTGLDLGAQPEATRLPLLGLTYDPHDDAFTIVAEHLEHVVACPQAIDVEEQDGRLASLQLVGNDGTKQIVSFAPAS